jgi:hypothetical protein
MASSQIVSQVVPFPQSVPAVNSTLPKHFLFALDSGWTVVPGSIEIRCFQGRWSGRLLLTKEGARVSVSFIALDSGTYRFGTPQRA